MTKQDILIQKLQIDTILNNLDQTNERSTKAEILLKYFEKFFQPAKIKPETFLKVLHNAKVDRVFPPDTIALDNRCVVQIDNPEAIGPDRLIGVSRLIDEGERIEFYTQTSGVIVRPNLLTVIYLNGLAETIV